MVCMYCGKQLVNEARFCAFCGKSTKGHSPPIMKSVETSSADEVIARLRDDFGMDAEKTEDGGVRITNRRYNEDIGMYELELAVTPMTTSSGHTVKGISLPEGVTEIANRAFNMA